MEITNPAPVSLTGLNEEQVRNAYRNISQNAGQMRMAIITIIVYLSQALPPLTN